MIPWSYFEGDGDHSSLLNTGPISVKASFPMDIHGTSLYIQEY